MDSPRAASARAAAIHNRRRVCPTIRTSSAVARSASAVFTLLHARTVLFQGCPASRTPGWPFPPSGGHFGRRRAAPRAIALRRHFTPTTAQESEQVTARNSHRVRRPPLRLPLVLALMGAASATGQDRSTTPLISIDAGFTAAAAPSPDAVRPVVKTITLRDAVAQAIGRNATARVAAADIRRVGGIMEEVRAASLPTLGVNATYKRLNKEITSVFPAPGGGTENVTVAPRDSIRIDGTLSIPILAPAAWADWTRAADNLDSAKLSERDVQRTVGITTARAYLTVFAQKRQVEVNRQARDNALAHMQYSDARLRGGIGNRVDWARAGQDLEQNEALLQSSYANLYRSQEALGILLGEDEPVDVEDVPQIPPLPTLEQAMEESQGRADILLFRQQETAADRSLNMSLSEYLPSITVAGGPV